ncbi:hypothetical protein T484DRAFT_1789135 [Baffinella frigidus]|nr:hypothetical protein T484DRAFT_1789135 [Cryptophyta sp. CCMP2293]
MVNCTTEYNSMYLAELLSAGLLAGLCAARLAFLPLFLFLQSAASFGGMHDGAAAAAVLAMATTSGAMTAAAAAVLAMATTSG